MLNLDKDAKIYQLLKKLNNDDNWWTRLKNDENIYIDIRQGNIINIYHNGGSILKIDSPKTAKINYAYLPLESDDTYVKCDILDNEIKLKDKVTIDLDDLSNDKIEQIKKLIKNYFPSKSEKGIQGGYATDWKRKKNDKNGFFIDTELQYSRDGRIDLIYLNYKDPNMPRLYFVELKTKGDDRLWDDTCDSKEKNVNICEQLNKYTEFIKSKKSEIINYYKKLYSIKKELDLIPSDAKDINIEQLSLEDKPVLLIGDATNDFIYKNKESQEPSDEIKRLECKLKKENCACMIICRKHDYNALNIFESKSRNIFMINR